MPNFVFDSLNIVAAFSMFLCFLSEVVKYLFYYKRPTTKVNWWVHLKHIPHQEQKKEREKRLQHRCFRVNFAKFLRTLFLRTLTVAASEDEQDETKLLHMTFRLNKRYLWMICFQLFWQPVEMGTYQAKS